jgi:microsomal dipeptidase-like Zn-dependent dipeptidase
MRLDSALKKSRPQYISAQKISTLVDALDECEIARKFSDSRAFMAVPVSYYVVTIYGIDAVANEIDVVLKFFDLGLKIQDFI